MAIPEPGCSDVTNATKTPKLSKTKVLPNSADNLSHHSSQTHWPVSSALKLLYLENLPAHKCRRGVTLALALKLNHDHVNACLCLNHSATRWDFVLLFGRERWPMRTERNLCARSYYKSHILNSVEFRRCKSLSLAYPYSSIEKGLLLLAFASTTVAVKSHRCCNSCFHHAFLKTWNAIQRIATTLFCCRRSHLPLAFGNKCGLETTSLKTYVNSGKQACALVCDTSHGDIPFAGGWGNFILRKKTLLHFYNWFNKVVTLHWCFPNCLLVVWNMVWSSGWWERWTLLCPF